MTPKAVRMTVEAYQERMEQEIKQKNELIEYQAWISGMYVAHAIACNFAKNASYPDNPLLNREAKGSKQGLTDGERFAMFAMKHNSQIREQQGK